MTRLQRFVRTVVSSYAQLGLSMLYQLASIPLALRFLTKEEFGLWALMTQIAGYLLIVDFGITSAIARLLIDYKDQRDGGDYGSLLQTGWLVLATQAMIILFVGIGFSPEIESALRISPGFHKDFPVLMRWLCIFQALILTTRVTPQILYAHQRSDVVNYSSMVQQPVSFVILWMSFRAGQGVYSYLWPLGVSWAIDMVILSASCLRLGFLPRRGAWGRPSWHLFRRLFDFGKDVFLVSVGFQLMMASQTVIITRNLGLTAAATWAVCTKAFAMIYILLWRIADFSIPAFSEMIARGEHEVMRRRWRDLMVFIGAVTGVAVVMLAVCNQSFVAVWTHGKISWWAGNDILLAMWAAVNTLAHCHCAFVPASGKIGALRYVYFLEGAMFVVLASVGSKFFGITSIIAASVVCTTFVSGLYGAHHTARYCGFSMREVALSWQARLGAVLMFLVPIAAVTWWISSSLSPFVQLVIRTTVVGFSGAYLLLRRGVPPSLQPEVSRYLPTLIRPALQRWSGWT